jgi:hypothetical protein
MECRQPGRRDRSYQNSDYGFGFFGFFFSRGGAFLFPMVRQLAMNRGAWLPAFARDRSMEALRVDSGDS